MDPELLKTYLMSPEWHKTAQRKLDRHQTCLLCKKNSEYIQPIDLTIETLFGAKPWMLISLCKDCHHQINFVGEDRRSMYEARKVLIDLIGRNESCKKVLPSINYLENKYRREKYAPPQKKKSGGKRR